MEKKRVAAYCRVSTRLEEQEGSYENQMEYFRKKIESDPYMELVGLYGDKGSGFKTKNRKGLQSLICDCEAGKVDLVLTKSVSRFARNMADCVELVQKFRAMNVTVIFEKESLCSSDIKCDLFLNIFAALAQEESNSISQNIIRSHEQRAEEGRPYGNVAYGYYKSGDRVWQVNPVEAKRVKKAFAMAAEGHNYPEIIKELNQIEAEEKTGYAWRQVRIKRMLRNVVYMGDIHTNENVCMTVGHLVKNLGYRDRIYIEGHHEPLVSRALFERVQRIFERGILISNMPRTPEKIELLNDKSWLVNV